MVTRWHPSATWPRKAAIGSGLVRALVSMWSGALVVVLMAGPSSADFPSHMHITNVVQGAPGSAATYPVTLNCVGGVPTRTFVFTGPGDQDLNSEGAQSCSIAAGSVAGATLTVRCATTGDARCEGPSQARMEGAGYTVTFTATYAFPSTSPPTTSPDLAPAVPPDQNPAPPTTGAPSGQQSAGGGQGSGSNGAGLGANAGAAPSGAGGGGSDPSVPGGTLAQLTGSDKDGAGQSAGGTVAGGQGTSGGAGGHDGSAPAGSAKDASGSAPDAATGAGASRLAALLAVLGALGVGVVAAWAYVRHRSDAGDKDGGVTDPPEPVPAGHS